MLLIQRFMPYSITQFFLQGITIELTKIFLTRDIKTGYHFKIQFFSNFWVQKKTMRFFISHRLKFAFSYDIGYVIYKTPIFSGSKTASKKSEKC